MPQQISTHQFANGLVLIAERMDWVESAAMNIQLSAGCTRDPSDRLGLANLTSDMAQRGCGDHDARQFVDALDRIGADHGVRVSPAHTHFSAVTLGENLGKAIELLGSLVRTPHLPESQLEESRQACFHEMQSFEDDLAGRAIQTVKERAYGDPWGRRPSGLREHVQSMTHRDVVDFVKQHYIPDNAVISVAGKIDWPQLKDQVASVFGDWPSRPQPELNVVPGLGGHVHIPYDSGQTQIALAYPTVPYAHEDYFLSRGAIGVLSDGMSSRLFTEIREARGLCYSVFGTYHSLPHAAQIVCYVGTRTERAQESLDVLLAEIRKLAQGISPQELDRLKARVRSALIMQQEMSSARCGSMAADWFHLKRFRTMDEINTTIDQLTCERINAFLARNPPTDFSLVTLGSQSLEASLAVS